MQVTADIALGDQRGQLAAQRGLDLAGVLVVATAAGMVQARAMTRLRRRAMSTPDDDNALAAVRRGKWLASGVRSLMAILTLAIVVLGAQAIVR